MQIIKIPKEFEGLVNMLNQIFEIEKKLEKIKEPNTIQRNLNRIKEIFEKELPLGSETGLVIHNPIGEDYDSSRIDCEANIAGESIENLVIVEVIRPIIRLKQGGYNSIVQKAVVVVQSKNSFTENSNNDINS